MQRQCSIDADTRYLPQLTMAAEMRGSIAFGSQPHDEAAGESGKFLISLYRENRLPSEVNRTAKNN